MKSADVVLYLVRRAGSTGGVVTRGQILGAGGSDKLIAGLVRSGTVKRVHRGVFVLAGAPGGHLRAVKAAVAAVGAPAVASHRSAAWLSGLIETPPARPHITKVTGRVGAVPGIVIHRAGAPLRVRYFQGVPCTDVARTLVDLAASAPAPELARAVDRALAGGVTRIIDLRREVDASPRRGVAALRRCLTERGEFCAPSASVLEATMARLFVRRGMPLPAAEVCAGAGGRYRLDYAYRDRFLAVELHGYTWHHSPDQMRADLVRQNALVLQGWVVLVYTWVDVVHDGGRVVAEISRAYARGGGRMERSRSDFLPSGG